MQKYSMAYYKKVDTPWFTNGGRLIVTDDRYVIKYLFRTVATFDATATAASVISPVSGRNGLRLTDYAKSIDLYFFSKTANELYELFKLK